ncbi:MAG: class I tRNA ligase family protein [Anaerolineae bacterium]
MFAFDWQKGGPWDPEGIKGPQRFLNDVWALLVESDLAAESEATDKAMRDLRRATHQTIMRVSDGLESFSFNTSIAALMAFKNTLQSVQNTPVVNTEAWTEAVETLVKLLAPFAPHIAEELWRNHFGHPESVHVQPWPEADEEIAAEDVITLIVQVNGKLRDRIEVPADIDEDAARETALASEKVNLEGEPRKVIYVPGRLVNIVT